MYAMHRMLYHHIILFGRYLMMQWTQKTTRIAEHANTPLPLPFFLHPLPSFSISLTRSISRHILHCSAPHPQQGFSNTSSTWNTTTQVRSIHSSGYTGRLIGLNVHEFIHRNINIHYPENDLTCIFNRLIHIPSISMPVLKMNKNIVHIRYECSGNIECIEQCASVCETNQIFVYKHGVYKQTLRHPGCFGWDSKKQAKTKCCALLLMSESGTSTIQW